MILMRRIYFDLIMVTKLFVFIRAKGFYATDGMCKHEDEHLEFGMVMDTVLSAHCTKGASILLLVRL
jgi:nitrite reductase/ring-hydroxylating ferredoxin subunit